MKQKRKNIVIAAVYDSRYADSTTYTFNPPYDHPLEAGLLALLIYLNIISPSDLSYISYAPVPDALKKRQKRIVKNNTKELVTISFSIDEPSNWIHIIDYIITTPNVNLEEASHAVIISDSQGAKVSLPSGEWFYSTKTNQKWFVPNQYKTERYERILAIQDTLYLKDSNYLLVVRNAHDHTSIQKYKYENIYSEGIDIIIVDRMGNVVTHEHKTAIVYKQSAESSYLEIILHLSGTTYRLLLDITQYKEGKRLYNPYAPIDHTFQMYISEDSIASNSINNSIVIDCYEPISSNTFPSQRLIYLIKHDNSNTYQMKFVGRTKLMTHNTIHTIGWSNTEGVCLIIWFASGGGELNIYHINAPSNEMQLITHTKLFRYFYFYEEYNAIKLKKYLISSSVVYIYTYQNIAILSFVICSGVIHKILFHTNKKSAFYSNKMLKNNALSNIANIYPMLTWWHYDNFNYKTINMPESCLQKPLYIMMVWNDSAYMMDLMGQQILHRIPENPQLAEAWCMYRKTSADKLTQIRYYQQINKPLIKTRTGLENLPL